MRGLFLVLPLAIVLFLLSFVFKFVFKTLTPISKLLGPATPDIEWVVNLLSLIIMIAFLVALGMIMQNRRSKAMWRKFEGRYLSRIPMYGVVRDTVEQFAGLKEMPFKRVVLIDPFGNGVLMTGFVTEDIRQEIYTVFVPTAPNPTNGNIYHVPARQVRFLRTRPEDAMRTVMSMGTGSSCLFVSDEVPLVEIQENGVDVNVEIVKPPTTNGELAEGSEVQS